MSDNIDLNFGRYRLTGNGAFYYILDTSTSPPSLVEGFDSQEAAATALIGLGVPPDELELFLGGDAGTTGESPPPVDPPNGGGGGGGQPPQGEEDPPPASGVDPLGGSDIAEIFRLLLGASNIPFRDLFTNDRTAPLAEALVGFLLSDRASDRNFARDQAALEAARRRERQDQEERRETNSSFINSNSDPESGLLNLGRQLYQYQGERGPGNSSVRTGSGLATQVVSTRGAEETPDPGTFPNTPVAAFPGAAPPAENPSPADQPDSGSQEAANAQSVLQPSLMGRTNTPPSPGGFMQRYGQFVQQRGPRT